MSVNVVQNPGGGSWRRGQKGYIGSKPWERDELHKISSLDNKALVHINSPSSIYLNS